MSHTVLALYKKFGKLIEAGHGRKRVQVDSSTFHHPLEDDGAVILDVDRVDGPEWIGMTHDDGGTKLNRDGSESGSRVVILRGEWS